MPAKPDDKLDLYGVPVPAHQWNTLKQLADYFFGLTLSSTPEKYARKWSALHAIKAYRTADYEAKQIVGKLKGKALKSYLEDT